MRTNKAEEQDAAWSLDSVVNLLAREQVFDGVEREALKSLVPMIDDAVHVKTERSRRFLSTKGDPNRRGYVVLLLDGSLGQLSATPQPPQPTSVHDSDTQPIAFLRFLSAALPGSRLIGLSTALLNEPPTVTLCRLSESAAWVELRTGALRALASKHLRIWEWALRRSHEVIAHLTDRVIPSASVRQALACMFWLRGMTHGVRQDFGGIRDDISRSLGVKWNTDFGDALNNFVDEGLVERPRRGKYLIPSTQSLETLAQISGAASQSLRPFTKDAFATIESPTSSLDAPPHD